MRALKQNTLKWVLVALATFWMLVIVPLSAAAAPYAALVMDARNGEVLHARNADTRLHPASLTKMMTLYIVFEAVENGEIGLDTMVNISRHAASEPPSKLGLRAGQNIKLRFLIRAAAVKSANDAATALAEAIEGSEAKFARRMNRTAKAMGMTRTTFKNAHGLTEAGHLSTARDMTILGRHLFYDFPDYYNLFSRIKTHAGVREVHHTNRKLLNSYRGADGIKTGYTRAAGFNLTASAERGGERIIATVYGGRSTATRNARVAELLDLGFRRAPSRVALHRPARPAYMGKMDSGTVPGSFGKKERTLAAAAVRKSLRPQARPLRVATVDEATIEEAVEAAQAAAKAAAAARAEQEGEAQAAATGTEAGSTAPTEATPAATDGDTERLAAIDDGATLRQAALTDVSEEEVSRAAPATGLQITVPAQQDEEGAAQDEGPAEDPVLEVVERSTDTSGRRWGITVGRYPSQYKARKVLLQVALNEMSTLDGSTRKVLQSSAGFDANFTGLTRETAERACRRLAAKKITCFMIEPTG